MADFQITDEQGELLKVLAEAYQVPDERSQRKEPLMYFTALQVGTQVQHPGLPNEGVISVLMLDLDELDRWGLIRLRPGRDRQSGGITVPAAGYAAVEQLAREAEVLAGGPPAPPEAGHLGLDWQIAVLPVLEQVVSLFAGTGVLQDAINEGLGRPNGAAETGVVLRKLEEAGYVQATMSVQQVEGPLACEPTAKALELLAGWPTERSDVALQQLISALERKIEEAGDEEEKSKLKRLLASIQDVGERVMTGVIADVIKSEL